MMGDAESFIRAGRRAFFAAHQWSFLTIPYTFQTIAPYKTGTVAVVNGVVTLTGGIFPATSAGQMFSVGGATYRIATRDSDTQLTLVNTAVDADAGSEFSVFFMRYPMHPNFAQLVGPVVVFGGTPATGARTAVFPQFELDRMYAHATVINPAKPTAFALESEITDIDTCAVEFSMFVFPYPDREYNVSVNIRVLPGDALDSPADEVMFPPYVSELLRLATLAHAEITYNSEPGVFAQTYEQQLQLFIKEDKRQSGSRNLIPSSPNPRLGYGGSTGYYGRPGTFTVE